MPLLGLLEIPGPPRFWEFHLGIDHGSRGEVTFRSFLLPFLGGDVTNGHPIERILSFTPTIITLFLLVLRKGNEKWNDPHTPSNLFFPVLHSQHPDSVIPYYLSHQQVNESAFLLRGFSGSLKDAPKPWPKCECVFFESVLFSGWLQEKNTRKRPKER